MINNEEFDVVVVGAGPSGLMAAISAARNGCTVLILERTDSPAKKLLASGGGRCNVTNTVPRDKFARSFGKEKTSLVTTALKQFNANDVITFFKSLGVELCAEDGIHYFPKSNKSSDVLNALKSEVDRLSIPIRYNCAVSALCHEKGFFTGVLCANEIISAHAGIMASGGCGYHGLGGNMSGLKMLEKLSYTVVPPIPGLVGLSCCESWPSICAGLTLNWARLKFTNKEGIKHITTGGLLFTHKGISGPAALDISAFVNRDLDDSQTVVLKCIVQEEVDNTVWNDRFAMWQQKQGNTLLVKRLAEFVPQKLADVFMQQATCPLEIRCSDVSRKHKALIVELLTGGLVLNVCANDGWDKAMVMAGGVACSEVHVSTLMSKHHEGLFFAGEILDCDGPCGGYNLTWAFSSGFVAGKSAGEYIHNKKI